MQFPVLEMWDWGGICEVYPDAPSSRSGRHRWQRKHGFPKPVYLTPNHPRWYRNEVVEWFNSRPRSYHDVVAEGRSSSSSP